MTTYQVDRLNAALTGRYEVQREIGAGGMATVYLARDLRHNRNVALKVLKPELAAVVGADRFLAEIETTANLQHPHVLPLYDSGQADSILFYVMPFVEGETLADRLDREKQLPVDEAVRIAVAVAQALDYAHRHGVVHRDIKPGNILMQDGQPVVGDFGIALAVGSAGAARLTETGLSVGTPFYMSPEQATGDMDIGPASDLYSLAAVLYELLTGEPPYTGKTAQAVLGRIIQGTPVSATTLRKTVPPNVDQAIRKALETLPADRFASAADFARALTDPGFRHVADAALAAAGAGAGPWRWVSVGLAASTLALGVGLARAVSAPAPVRSVERYAMPFLPGEEVGYLGGAGYSLSPDGSMLVYRHNVGGQQVLVVRRWDELAASPVRETEGASLPVVSPDGLEIAFGQAGAIRALALAGGPVRTLLSEGGRPYWGRDGYVYTSTDSGAVRVPAAGGAVEVVSRLEEGEDGREVRELLPGGRRALLQVSRVEGEDEIRGLDLESGESTHLVYGVNPRYLSSGHLVYGVPTDAGGLTLMAVSFEPRRMELVGTPVALLDGLAAWSLSDDGKLFYSIGQVITAASRPVQMLWVDREGEAAPVDASWTFQIGGPDTQWRLSPDGTLLATRELTAEGLDIWIKQIPVGPRTRLTFGEAEERMPDWVPGTRDVSFISSRGGGNDVWKRSADVTREAELVLDFERDIATYEWSPDGQWLVVRTSGPRGAEGGRDIYAFRPGVDTAAAPLLADQGYDEMYPDISPDGRWIAYQSTESDRHEIYVRPFPDVSAARWQVSFDGGRQPRWSPDGRELFFQDPDDRMMVVDVEAGAAATFRSGTPRVLFESEGDWVAGDITGTTYEVAADGQRFVVAGSPVGADEEEASTPSAILVNNFIEVLRVQVPR